MNVRPRQRSFRRGRIRRGVYVCPQCVPKVCRVIRQPSIHVTAILIPRRIPLQKHPKRRVIEPRAHIDEPSIFIIDLALKVEWRADRTAGLDPLGRGGELANPLGWWADSSL